jgi:hypothetical protein
MVNATTRLTIMSRRPSPPITQVRYPGRLLEPHRVATKGGRRLKLRYHGVTKNDFWLYMRIGALNLRRLHTLGVTHHAGTWTLT